MEQRVEAADANPQPQLAPKIGGGPDTQRLDRTAFLQANELLLDQIGKPHGLTARNRMIGMDDRHQPMMAIRKTLQTGRGDVAAKNTRDRRDFPSQPG